MWKGILQMNIQGVCANNSLWWQYCGTCILLEFATTHGVAHCVTAVSESICVSHGYVVFTAVLRTLL